MTRIDDLEAELLRVVTTRAVAQDAGAKGPGGWPTDLSCPLCHKPKKRRFKLYPGGRWRAHCCDIGGRDAIALHVALNGLKRGDAITDLAEKQGLDVDSLARLSDGARADRAAALKEERRRAEARKAAEEAARRERSAAAAVDLFRDASPLGGDLAATYLCGRGMDPAALRWTNREGAVRAGWPPSLRFHPSIPHPDAPTAARWPALIGLIQAPDGAPIGAHRTYLAADGSDKASNLPDGGSAKCVMGLADGGAIRLSRGPGCFRLVSGMVEGVVILGEGIEDALSLLIAAPGAPIWAGISRGNICGYAQGERRGPRHQKKFWKSGRSRYVESQRPDRGRTGLAIRAHARICLAARDRDDDRADSDAMYERLRRAGASRTGATGPMALWVADGPDGSDPNSLLRGEGVTAVAAMLRDASPLAARPGP